MSTDDLMASAEMASFAGLQSRRLTSWMNSGVLLPVRKNGRCYWTRQEAEIAARLVELSDLVGDGLNWERLKDLAQQLRESDTVTLSSDTGGVTITFDGSKPFQSHVLEPGSQAFIDKVVHMRRTGLTKAKIAQRLRVDVEHVHQVFLDLKLPGDNRGRPLDPDPEVAQEARTAWWNGSSLSEITAILGCSDAHSTKRWLKRVGAFDRPAPRRFPLAPLAAEAGSEKAISRHINVSGATLKRARETGLTEDQADKWADALGIMAHDIWPDFLDPTPGPPEMAQ